jgi:hypothetical protein
MPTIEDIQSELAAPKRLGICDPASASGTRHSTWPSKGSSPCSVPIFDFHGLDDFASFRPDLEEFTAFLYRQLLVISR